MISISGSRSSGKIIRPRRTSVARATTPYGRPAHPSPNSTNWLSRYVISPTRFVASGAGKILSTVLDLDSSPTSSYDTDSAAQEEEVDTFDDENDTGNNRNKYFIEQLVMQETFSRKECDRLIEILRSRVVDSPANDVDGDKGLGDMPNRILGSDTASPDLCSAAVIEAKKWLQEKKSGLDSKLDLNYGSHSLNLTTLPPALKDEGSPVDLAKSYMHTLPPWSSPSLDHIKPPMPAGIQLFKEEEPHLFGGKSTSSSKLKMGSSATRRSWSIKDEIRRVRSRATEEMLSTLPSSKIDWSVFSMENKNNVNSSAIKNSEATLREKVHDFTNFVDASSNLARGLGTQASPALKSELDGFQPESVLSDPAIINSEQNQGSGAILETNGSQDDCRGKTSSGQREGFLDDMHRKGGFLKVNGINNRNEANCQLDSVEEAVEAISPRLHDGNYLEFKEKVGADDTLANGVAPSGPSLYAGDVIEQNTNTLDNGPNTLDLSQERPAKVVLEQESRMLSSESIEVPDVMENDAVAVKENDGIASASQNSSSVQYETQQGSESELAATPTSIAKQKGKRITTRYNRRSRGRSVR